MVKVSIIIPLYNKVQYIEKCIKSVVNQTLKDIEIIVVNDGSTDGSEIIVEKLMQHDCRIKLFSKENGGLSSARNYGIDKANGEYLIFLDGDDYVEYNMYELLYDWSIKNNLDVNMCSYVFEYHNRTEMDNRLEDLDKKIFKRDESEYLVKQVLLMNIDTGVCIKLFKRNFLLKNKLKFDENLLLHEDYPFVINAYEVAEKVSFMDKKMYHYVMQDNSSMSRDYNDSRLNKLIMVYKTIFDKTNELSIKKYVDIWFLKNTEYLLNSLYNHCNNFNQLRYSIKKIFSNDEMKKIIFNIEWDNKNLKLKQKVKQNIFIFCLKNNFYNIYSIFKIKK